MPLETTRLEEIGDYLETREGAVLLKPLLYGGIALKLLAHANGLKF